MSVSMFVVVASSLFVAVARDMGLVGRFVCPVGMDE